MIILISGLNANHGSSGAGKSYAAKVLHETLPQDSEIISLADPIKAQVATELECSLGHLESIKFQGAVRKRLQEVGENACKDDPLIWAKLAALKIAKSNARLVLVPDLRKMVEYVFLKNTFGEITLLTVASDAETLVSPKHSSEVDAHELALRAPLVIHNDNTPSFAAQLKEYLFSELYNDHSLGDIKKFRSYSLRRILEQSES